VPARHAFAQDQPVNDLDGHPAGDSDLFARVYAELKTIARRHMSGENCEHTLQATALVNEAWLRLREQVDEARDNPGRFYAAAAEAMRRILIEHARRRGRQKRGGGLKKLSLDLVTVADAADLDQVLAIDAAIERLQAANARAAQLVRLRFFAGLTEVAAGDALGISERTARREWTFARAWLYDALNR
jgi:RNA polymerase sigma factor (TIGR02999 family)